MVAGVGHDEVRAAGTDGLRTLELSKAGSVRSKLAVKPRLPLGKIKALDAVVAGVGHVELAIIKVGNIDALRRRELAVAGAERSERVGERAIGPKDLDAVVAGVGHDDHPREARNADALRRRELAVAGAERSEPAQERSVCGEYLDAVVAGVGHGNNAFAYGIRSMHRNALRRRELPVACAVRTELKGQGAVFSENLNAVVAGVGHKNSVVVVHGNAFR